MAIPSGLSAQLGAGEETTYGTAATISRFFPFRTESLALDVQRMESTALRSGGRLLRADRWAPGRRSVAGDVALEVETQGLGLWFKHALGGVTTDQPDASGAPEVYRHRFAIGDLPTGLTVQVGRPDQAGTVHPYTYTGCRISSWTLECQVDEIATLQLSLLGQDCTTATPLATATYPAGSSLLTWARGAITLDGAELCVRSLSLQGTNGLAEDRYCLGNPLRRQPSEMALREITGTLEVGFEDLALYQRFVQAAPDQPPAELVVLLEGPTIAGTYRSHLQITAQVRIDANTPVVGGAELLMQQVPIRVVDTGTASLVIEYQTTDTTP